jgi:hypothetical protein
MPVIISFTWRVDGSADSQRREERGEEGRGGPEDENSTGSVVEGVFAFF